MGGFKLFVDVQGTYVPGQPTVVFDSGAGSTYDDWQVEGVQQAIAEKALTISYNRAGLGSSEESGLPKTADEQTRQLHTLLQVANLPPPYLLVSHSIAGLNARVFTDHYADAVYGVVFVDSSHERQNEGYWQPQTMVLMRDSGEMTYEEYSQTTNQVKDSRERDLLRNKPITVLSSTCHFSCDTEIEDPIESDWQEFQRDIATLSDDSVHLVAPPQTHHYLMIAEPQMVIDGIREILDR